MKNENKLKPFQYYSGSPMAPSPESPIRVPPLLLDKQREAAAYIANERLVDAVNVALILGQPLLLTGDPGTGKTHLAYSVGRELGYPVYKFETKSTSTASDLFYTYDTLRRFHDVRFKIKRESIDYVTYHALGIAILQSQELSKIERWRPANFNHNGPQRSIVLIDEVDKAPRDFPNDLLNEIEGMYFKIPELGMGNEIIEASKEMNPVIIITSNSEKSLPDPFLRRCIFYDIPFPDRDRLIEIVLSHLATIGVKQPAWIEDAMDFFVKLLEPVRKLDKKPATAELLNWITYLRKAGIGDEENIRKNQKMMYSSLSALFKSKSDQERADSILKEWIEDAFR